MTIQGDPYRTLGVAPGASLNEIRSAYRRLAKQYHPDAAGERALPRFLAIQAAYERLVDGEGRLRTAGQGRTARPETRPGAASWRADPARARATRDAWRASRRGGASAGGTSAGGAAEGASGSRARPGGDRPSGAAGSGTGDGRTGATAGERDGAHQGERPPRRWRRKATPGSTSYDEALETPRDPRWDGGAWYGPTMGTYWTINPREYADPRKHGPEYQARARRAALGRPDEGIAWPPDAMPPVTGAPESPDAPAHGPTTATTAGQAETPGAAHAAGPADGSAAAASAGPAEAPATARNEDATGAPAAQHVPPAPGARPFVGPLPDLRAIARSLAPERLAERVADPGALGWRLGLAVAGWPPPGLVLGAVLVGVGLPPWVALFVQPFVVACLFAVPRVVVHAAVAAVAALVVVVPLAAILGLAPLSSSQVAAVLRLAAVVAYGAAVGVVELRLRRQAGEPRPGA